MHRRTVLWATITSAALSMFPLSAHSQVVANLLSPLVQLWVRSQVEQVDDLRVAVNGPDAQLVNGQIDRIELSGRNLQYRGVTARALSLRGTDIRLDTSQALQGSGLRLLRAVRAEASLSLSEADVNTYLASAAFQEQIANLKVRLPASLGGQPETEVPLEIRQPQARLLRDRLELAAVVRIAGGEPAPLRIASGIAVAGPHLLRLVDPRLVDQAGNSAPIEALANQTIRLGDDLELKRVTLLPGQLLLEGTYEIKPTPTANLRTGR